jgi:hypothetical protein
VDRLPAGSIAALFTRLRSSKTKDLISKIRAESIAEYFKSYYSSAVSSRASVSSNRADKRWSMKPESPEPGPLRYKSESWRDAGNNLRRELPSSLGQVDNLNPDARERSRLLQLLGSINYKIVKGNRVYIEVGGIVYKTLWGLYWRSVFTGVEHYLLRCQQISSVWTDGSNAVDMIDLPITRTKEGWTAQGHSLMFMLNRD